MRFEELSHMMQKPDPKPDTYEAGMAQNQLLKIGTHAIRLHNMIDDGQEMESWVAKKIDLASNYVKSVHGYTAGSKAGTYDDDGMSEGTDTTATDKEIKMAKGIAFDKRNKDNMSKATSTIEKVRKGLSQQPDVADALRTANEDAGEGHMSKSQLYATAKMAIELIDMIKKGDDLEGWVQAKLNIAADYLQAVYHYEDYQKLNPYREEIDSALVQKHAGVIQKHLDEILARETETADVDTKPGMMRILKKRVNEVEKEIAKENRKNTEEATDTAVTDKEVKMAKGIAFDKRYKDNYTGASNTIEKIKKGLSQQPDVADALKRANEMLETLIAERMPASVIQSKQKFANMSDEELANRFKDKDERTLRQMAWRHGYGNMSSHYLDRVRSVMTGKKTATTEAELEEGIKDWAKNVAMAGVVVAGLAGVGSINDAINNSVPAIQAMNTALEMAQDSNNDALAKAIEKDLSDAKLRLDTGKDLNHVKYLQDKYSKFVSTEGLAYESKLALQLNQQLK